MANLFELLGTIAVDNKTANKSIDETSGKSENMSSRVGSAFGKVAKGAAAVGTAAVAGAAALGTAAFKMAGDTSAAADRVDKMSQKMGLSREGFQEWDFIMSQSGMSIDSAGVAMKTMTAAMDDMKKGGDASKETLGALGITTNDLKNLNREEIFEKSIKALQTLPEGYEKAALANKLFGKQGMEMMPLLNSQAGSIEEMKKQAHELGMVLGDDTVDAGVKFTDTMDAFKRSLGGAMSKLGGAVLPIIQKVMDVVVDNMPMIQGLIEQFAPVLASLFEKLFPPLMELAEKLFPVIIDLIMALLPPIMDIITSILPVVIQLIEILMPPIIKIVEMVLPLLIKLIEPLMPLLEPILMLLTPMIDLLMMILEPLMELLDLILPPLIQVISWLIEKALVPLQNAFEIVSGILGGTVKAAFGGVKNYVDTVINVFKGIIDFIKNVFTGNWKGAWQSVKDIFTSIFDGIKGAFKIPINWIIDGINVFIRSLNKIKIPDWVPGVGGKGFHINQMVKLRRGIDYVPYDDFPALLHKGERVTTEFENRQEQKAEKPVVQTSPIEISLNIENFVNNRKQDIEQLVDEILDVAEQKRKRTGEVYA